jgi:hypothetical protein
VISADAISALNEGNSLRKTGRAADALGAFRRAVQLAPDFASAHYNLGIALREHGELRQAILAFRGAWRLDSKDMDAVQNVVDTVGLAIERGVPPMFPTPRPDGGASRSPVSILVCSIHADRLERMQRSFAATLGGREHEFIVIRDAKSLCEGYGRALANARHDIVVFSHDDVELISPDPFDALERALAEYDVVGIVGSRLLNGPGALWAGQPHLRGFVAYPPRHPGGPHRATLYSLETGVMGGMESLDGLLMAARRTAALRVGFDAATFDGFHCYDIDFTYRAKLAGLRVAVTTEVMALHASEGSFDEKWREYARRFQAKFPALVAPVGESFYFGRDFSSADQTLRFFNEVNGLGATP